MSYVTAFWVGGLICALCQILLEKTKLMPGRVMVILVCSGALLGAFNICGICRCRCIGAASRFRKRTLERC